jgi:hypothetical protein
MFFSIFPQRVRQDLNGAVNFSYINNKQYILKMFTFDENTIKSLSTFFEQVATARGRLATDYGLLALNKAQQNDVNTFLKSFANEDTAKVYVGLFQSNYQGVMQDVLYRRFQNIAWRRFSVLTENMPSTFTEKVFSHLESTFELSQLWPWTPANSGDLDYSNLPEPNLSDLDLSNLNMSEYLKDIQKNENFGKIMEQAQNMAKQLVSQNKNFP